MRRVLVIATMLAVLFAGCGRKKRVRVAPPPAPAPTVTAGSTEEGIASWYGHPYHGRPAANGEIYDMEKLTAAHRTLPLGTWVRVESLENHKTVDVRINDRGPFHEGRVIDLSHAAAKAIDMIGPGTARVRLEVISLPAAAGPALFAVQVGAFRDKSNAERLRHEMEVKYGAARLVLRPGDPPLWRVLVGSEPTQAGAGSLRERIKSDGGSNGAAFVVRVDS
ncbi:MAG TPA: septal ring lytic transglycosylase RlpA family protein [Bryobacteraceae bacterium]|nr:septal ring lytic transglycosylase RlpA family protein [Bryobacteraceae bacterium]